MILMLMLCFTDNPDLTFMTRFQTVPESSEHIISDPYSMHFSPAGDLYVADRIPGKIHQWRADGTYLRSFAASGQGPGELTRPVKIVVTEKAVWVWDFAQRFTSFDLEGNYLRSFALPGVEPRNFAVLSSNLFLLSYRKNISANERRQVFQLLDHQGKLGTQLANIKNEGVLSSQSTVGGLFKAYGAEGDIQKAPDGSFYYGYSQDNTLVQVNERGEELKRSVFDLPHDKPTDEDKQTLLAISFPNRRDGGRISIKSFPQLKFDFSHPKAYYSQFLFVGDKVVFVLTAIGDFSGAGNGFHKGHFYVNDFQSTKVLSRGSFSLPEDSALLMRDGRALVVIAGEEGYEISEVSFKGL